MLSLRQQKFMSSFLLHLLPQPNRSQLGYNEHTEWSYYSISVEKTSREATELLAVTVVSKDVTGVGIPDAMVMAEDRMRWKRVVAEHATPQEGMLPDKRRWIVMIDAALVGS